MVFCWCSRHVGVSDVGVGGAGGRGRGGLFTPYNGSGRVLALRVEAGTVDQEVAANSKLLVGVAHVTFLDGGELLQSIVSESAKWTAEHSDAA